MRHRKMVSFPTSPEMFYTQLLTKLYSITVLTNL